NALFVLVAGIHSITTVSKVSVKAGDSISIPCLYDSQYVNHVKYLCKGRTWANCDYEVKTNQINSGRFSISDNKTQRIFTVTVNDLTDRDTDYYWCAVEINRRLDDGVYFHLSVTRGTPSLTVDHQEITGFKGHHITINCYYSNPGEMKWCRLGMSCVTTRSSGLIDGTRVAIKTNGSNVFTVTMSGLKIESSGWYQCVKGDLQMPVHVTVTVQSTTSKYYTSKSKTYMFIHIVVQSFVNHLIKHRRDINNTYCHFTHYGLVLGYSHCHGYKRHLITHS
ncbi:polymeric immunoglobulin receptor-like, partial [Anarhichas minor]|uniref:polymeric immunoglobulin receptor-like n=1 Tax=Anarhichas minor TaxID=65739 RepID=UPI003F73DA99